MPTTLSPLRYPGGKTQFYPKLVDIFIDNKIDSSYTYLEPFAGGAGLALRLLADKKVGRIVLNDKDPAIFSFWDAVLNKTDLFIQKIQKTPITIDEWRKQRSIYAKGRPSFELGFAAFFLNRTNRSGIVFADPIGGLDQTGHYKIGCRFNKKRLIEKILFISSQKERIELDCLEACEFIEKRKGLVNSFWFIDPPYYQKGKQLYRNYYSNEGHNELSHSITRDLYDEKWVLTYDVCDEIKYIYRAYQFVEVPINYTVETKRKANELMFYNRLFLKD